MNNFKRKQWARIGLSLVAVAVAVLFLTGIIGGKPMTYQIGVNENAVSAAEKGFGGDVTVHLELDGKKVKSLTIDTPDETEGLGKRASDKEFTDQFVGKEGPFTFGKNGVEALSGATVTSNAALKAINGLITGEKPAEAEKPAATEAPAAETEKNAETEKPAEAADEPKMSAMASEQGFGGKVTVRVETDLDQVIKALTVETPDETEGIGKRVSEAAFTDQFIGKTGPFTFGENGIEAVSGATVTSTAALKALNRTYVADGMSEETEKPAEEEKPAETEKPAEAADEPKMSAMASEQGFGGKVTVRVETDLDQVVKALTVETPDETEGIGKRVSEAAFTDQFIGKTGPFTFGENGIEAVSGATVTSTAALKALNRTYAAEEIQEEAEKPAETEKPAEEEKPAETETPAAEPADAADELKMSAMAWEQGFGGEVSVRVETDLNQVVKALTIETPDETEGIGKRVSEAAFTDQFIGKAGPFTFGENGIEAVSGATVTSTAALKALNRTFGAEEKTEETEKPAEEAKPAETEKPAEEEKPTETEKPAETSAVKEESTKAPAAYGSYLSVKETDFSTIRVIVTARNGVLTDCRIRSEAKSAGSDFLTDEIKAAWAKAIVENQSADTDAISGATLKFSAGAVKEAVAEILEKIQGK